jgi:hypothetical protein
MSIFIAIELLVIAVLLVLLHQGKQQQNTVRRERLLKKYFQSMRANP